LIVAGLFEGEIVRRGQRQCKRGMLRSAGQDDTGEQMNLPCRREAEPHAPGPATKFGFQILASCGSHKGGKTAHRQAKNLSTAFSTTAEEVGPRFCLRLLEPCLQRNRAASSARILNAV
jgi:hypothetical protein